MEIVLKEVELALNNKFGIAIENAELQIYEAGLHIFRVVIELNEIGLAVFKKTAEEFNEFEINRLVNMMVVEKSYLGTRLESEHTYDQIMNLEGSIRKLKQVEIPSGWNGLFGWMEIKTGESNRMVVYDKLRS